MSLKRFRWPLLKNCSHLPQVTAVVPYAFIAQMTAGRAERARRDHELLYVSLQRTRINCVRAILRKTCGCAIHANIEPVREGVARVRKELQGAIPWMQTRESNGYLKALIGRYQAGRCRA